MLLSHVEKLLQDDGDSLQSLKSIVYRLGTSEKLYRGCELAISVMLSNIGCSTSECGMESLISAMKDNYSVFRPLSINQLHHELMIRINGPQPLHPSTTKFLLSTDTLEVAQLTGHSSNDHHTSIMLKTLK